MSGGRRTSIGVAGALGPDLIGRLAAAVEAAGFHALWVNDTPDGDAVAALGAAARATSRLLLATGVVPVDRRPPEGLADEVAAAGIPPERLLLGIGPGTARKGSLARTHRAIETLRERTGARIVVGALGPRMRRLGAQHGDGLLLNWVPADQAAVQAGEAHAVSPSASVAVYVRTALDPAARPVLEREAARYGSFPNYAANFQRLGVAPMDTTFADAGALRDGLAAYEAAADEVVLRAVTAGSDVTAYLAFVAAAADAAGLHGA